MTTCTSPDGRHEWAFDSYYQPYCLFCHGTITEEQALAMLNAAERLTAEDAEEITWYAMPMVYIEMLKSYVKFRGE